MLCISLQWREEMDFYLTGCQRRFRIGCKRRREFGYSYVPGVLTFQTEDGVEFHILRFFSVRIVSDLYDDLKQTSEYKPPQRATEIPRDVKTFGGIPLPRYSMAFSALLTFQLSVFVIVLFHHPSALVHGIPEEVSLKYFNSLKKLVWVWKKFFWGISTTCHKPTNLQGWILRRRTCTFSVQFQFLETLVKCISKQKSFGDWLCN